MTSTTATRSDRTNACKLCGNASLTLLCRIADHQLFCCRDCDFHFLDRLDPPPTEEAADLTADQQRYIDARLEASARRMSARGQLVRAFIDPAGCDCLDIGAGIGQFQRHLEAAGARCTGVEPSSLRRAYARRNFGLELSARPIDDPSWVADYGRFDLLTLWDVLEHVNDPGATLNAAAQLLRPGGLLCIETDHRNTLPYRLSLACCRLSQGSTPLFLSDIYRPVPYGHKQIFRPEQLLALLNRCGFEPLAATPRQAGVRPLPVAYRPAGRMVLVAVKRTDGAAPASPCTAP